jgi:hypothetical protein
MDRAGNVQGRSRDMSVITGEPLMNVVTTSTSAMNPEQSLLKSVPAANSDRLEAVQKHALESAGGWDAYEVWRRFIKDARDRRESNPS